MDKKVVIFFALLGLVMIGGSFVLSLWVLPNLLPYDAWASREEVIQPESEKDATGVKRNPRNKIKVSWILMISQMTGTLCIVLFVGIRLKKWAGLNRPTTAQGYIFKITRITDKSAYDVFCKAAEDWPVSEEQIKQDFKRYIYDDRVPYYVNDFIRKNKKHIDQIRISIFQFN